MHKHAKWKMKSLKPLALWTMNSHFKRKMIISRYPLRNKYTRQYIKLNCLLISRLFISNLSFKICESYLFLNQWTFENEVDDQPVIHVTTITVRLKWELKEQNSTSVSTIFQNPWFCGRWLEVSCFVLLKCNVN